jgi:hypothetical protein
MQHVHAKAKPSSVMMLISLEPLWRHPFHFRAFDP